MPHTHTHRATQGLARDKVCLHSSYCPKRQLGGHPGGENQYVYSSDGDVALDRFANSSPDTCGWRWMDQILRRSKRNRCTQVLFIPLNFHRGAVNVILIRDLCKIISKAYNIHLTCCYHSYELRGWVTFTADANIREVISQLCSVSKT